MHAAGTSRSCHASPLQNALLTLSSAVLQSRTKVAHKTLKPQWNEELHVLVQEPSTQLLRVEMFDHDIFNVKVRRS